MWLNTKIMDFYFTLKEVHHGQELLMWFGEEFANTFALGVNYRGLMDAYIQLYIWSK